MNNKKQTLHLFVKDTIFFKNPSNPSYIELSLTKSLTRFQTSTVAETGLSDFITLVVTVMKSHTPN